ncbi:MAG: DUF3592 domain-containing protein [Bryobacteraceae bacterium]|nr:DUF3592 domain-containing protein [Bryobacteraceae bacterium]
MSGRHTIAIVLVTLGTAATLVAAAGVPNQYHRIKTWLPAEGVVLRTCPAVDATPRLASLFSGNAQPNIHYVRYHYRGSNYVSPLPPERGSRPAGSRVALFVDPDRPGDVAVDLGWNWHTFSDPLLLFAAAIVQFAVGLRLFRYQPLPVKVRTSRSVR